jgi:hypothetical protein
MAALPSLDLALALGGQTVQNTAQQGASSGVGPAPTRVSKGPLDGLGMGTLALAAIVVAVALVVIKSMGRGM